ncbi:MAG: hypothetical protein GXP62_14610 [Oligoflexia bacterium]|nr:hypothetical protein [Oligoflexia bacterium]
MPLALLPAFLPALLGLSLPAGAQTLAPSSKVVVHIDGMVCSDCQQAVTGALEALPFVQNAVTSFAAAGACLSLSSPGETADIDQAVADQGYTVTSIEAVDACPVRLRPGHRIDPWEDTAGVDAVVVSHGEEVDLDALQVPGKYSVIDFGAPWCGPCHAAAAALRTYLRQHDDVAVRAITLDAADPQASYALPVARQHLKWVAGIPWFLVTDPAGRSVYKGADVDALIDAIDQRRARQ